MLKNLAMIVILGPLATISILAVSAEDNPANTPEKRVTEADKSSKAHPQTDTQNVDQYGQKTPSVVVQVGSPVSEADNTESRENLQIQRELALFTFLLVAVGALQAGTMIYQARLLKGTLAEVHQQARWMETQTGRMSRQADLMNRQNTIAISSARAAKEAADAALKQANHVVAAERAWMVAAMNPLAKTRTRASLYRIAPRLRNRGKTPAFILETAGGAVVLASGDPLPDIIPPLAVEKWEEPGIPLAPEAEFGGEIIQPFSDEGAVLKGDVVLWVFGYVKYRDALVKDIRESRYCFRWEGPDLGHPEGQFVIDGPPGYNKAT
jgi:hypothetical protein